MDRLPAEKRKAYLLKPTANLTYESMIETILGKDGITPEMIKSQQERVDLIDRLLQASSAGHPLGDHQAKRETVR